MQTSTVIEDFSISHISYHTPGTGKNRGDQTDYSPF